jgi:hypothetical protein
MDKTLKLLILPLLFIWELPQILLGIVVFAVINSRQKIIKIEQEAHHFIIETPNIGVSLGWIVFWTTQGNRFSHLNNDCRMHEFGHALQSAILGPLYLIIVGIPSISRVLYSKWYYKKYGYSWKNYFNGFPENWADRLGGVIPGKK